MLDVKDLLIDENCTMLEAMRLLDKLAKKVLFVTKNGRFSATITDGDIRRWILRKGNLDAIVRDIGNYEPQYLFEDKKYTAKSYMKKNSIEALPILNTNRDITSVVFWNDETIEKKKKIDVPVVIMAGGMGSRLYPYTKILPKPLIPIGEIPIAEHIINRFSNNGCRDFYLILNYKKNMIKAYFNDLDKEYHLTYIDENLPLGTGGGLSLLKGQIRSTFILSNCDILVEADYKKIYDHHKKEKNLITIVCSLKNIVIPYGVIEISETGEIEKMKEKPELSFFTNTGMYIVEPRVIEEMVENQEISFPDIVEKYRKIGERVGVYPISENSWLDMGQLDEMEKMRKRIEND